MLPHRSLRSAVLPATALAMLALGACDSSSDGGADANDTAGAADSSDRVTVTVTTTPTDDSTPPEPTVENPPQEIDPCTTGALEEASPEGWETIYCGSDWARIGMSQSDGMKLLRWTGAVWEDVEPDGETFTGFRCYDREKLISQGAPDDLFGNITVC